MYVHIPPQLCQSDLFPGDSVFALCVRLCERSILSTSFTLNDFENYLSK